MFMPTGSCDGQPGERRERLRAARAERRTEPPADKRTGVRPSICDTAATCAPSRANMCCCTMLACSPDDECAAARSSIAGVVLAVGEIAFRVGGSTYPFLDAKPLRRLQVGADVFVFNKFDDHGPLDEPTNSSRFLGMETDLYANWQLTSDLIARHCDGYTLTVLADGHVLVIGGNDDRIAEVFDPSHGRWTRLPSP